MSEYEREARRGRLDELVAAGIDPYPARVGERESIAAVRARFDAASGDELEADAPQGAIV